ncbi:DUF1284 domain-containing protein [Paenibacillus gansuensis]|uniref:DUF1284 domain-containing protein n=1 Tax=Paenibacillus gansuensis TaxID=306542 RepID=A0ABW5PB28_9BACL
MKIHLRGHHLLCLLGFRGMGYSPGFAANMRNVYEQLRESPETEVTLVKGADDLCSCFPADQPNHCDTPGVHAKDDAILDRLGLTRGETLSWNSIVQKIRVSYVPEDIPVLCHSCPWQPYGVCERGLSLIVSGQDLPPLPAT